jgi:two-component system OmpR family response regulator
MSNERTVLICDDDAAIRRLVATILKPDGYRFRDASDLASAKAALAESPPDLVILDLNIPGEGGGLAVVDHLRGDPSLSAVRVLMVTGSVHALGADWGQSVGADGHLAKPFELAELRTAVRELLAA